jgi:hypothetical protein
VRHFNRIIHEIVLGKSNEEIVSMKSYCQIQEEIDSLNEKFGNGRR